MGDWNKEWIKKKNMSAKILSKTNNKCAYCGKCLNEDDHWHIDHIVPKSQGGSNNIENYFASCSICNIRKNFRTPDEFKIMLIEQLQKKIEDASFQYLLYIYQYLGKEDREELNNAYLDLLMHIQNANIKFYYESIGALDGKG